jgi:hypothetical protein
MLRVIVEVKSARKRSSRFDLVVLSRMRQSMKPMPVVPSVHPSPLSTESSNPVRRDPGREREETRLRELQPGLEPVENELATMQVVLGILVLLCFVLSGFVWYMLLN